MTVFTIKNLSVGNSKEGYIAEDAGSFATARSATIGDTLYLGSGNTVCKARTTARNVGGFDDYTISRAFLSFIVGDISIPAGEAVSAVRLGINVTSSKFHDGDNRVYLKTSTLADDPLTVFDYNNGGTLVGSIEDGIGGQFDYFYFNAAGIAYIQTKIDAAGGTTWPTGYAQFRIQSYLDYENVQPEYDGDFGITFYNSWNGTAEQPVLEITTEASESLVFKPQISVFS